MALVALVLLFAAVFLLVLSVRLLERMDGRLRGALAYGAAPSRGGEVWHESDMHEKPKQGPLTEEEQAEELAIG